MALNLTGSCTCKTLRYTVKLDSADSARTSLCHCSSCKKAFGTNYGLTSKVRTRVLHSTHGKQAMDMDKSTDYLTRSHSRASNTPMVSLSSISRKTALLENFAQIAAHLPASME